MPPLYIKPINERKIIRMPEKQNQLMPVYGALVEKNVYWLRRLKDKDAVEINKSEFEKAKAKFEAKAKVEAESLKSSKSPSKNATDSEQ